MIAVLSPSLRNVPFTGVEWSYQSKDLGYDERGSWKRKDEEEEMSALNSNGGVREEIKEDGEPT